MTTEFTFEPTGDNGWMYLTGGTTDPAIKGVREFVRKYVAPDALWTFKGVRLRPHVPVHYLGNTTDEYVVAFDFEHPSGKRRSLFVDGFAWGYPGEGPSGLATALNEICGQFDVYPTSGVLYEVLRRWVLGSHQEACHELLATTIPTTEFMSRV